MKNIFGQTLEEIQSFCKEQQIQNFVAKQICEWLYKKNVSSFDEMRNISAKNRQLLSENFVIEKMQIADCQTSIDGTKKYLFVTDASQDIRVETVFLPALERNTLCVSSQAGCKMACNFCATGKMGFKKNLSSAEILSQFVSLPERDLMTNFVFMGMGEPMDNLDEVLKALKILTSDWGYAFSPRRITVSTIGLIPQMERFINESECHLAISMHSPFDYEREKLIPLQKKYAISDIVKSLKKQDWSHQRRLSFEYILFENLNDTYRHIDGISKLLKGLFCRVNIINFHENPESNFKASKEENLEYFRDKLNDKGLIATVRQSRGKDIMAACGLLAGESVRHCGLDPQSPNKNQTPL